MVIKGFNCDKCNKNIVCKYIESMNKFYEDNLNNYEQDLNNLSIIILEFKCIEYMQSVGLSNR